MGVSLMLSSGSGLAGETWTGARGAPMTPRRRRSPERRQDSSSERDGTIETRPFIHCPHPSSSGSTPSPSGPSASGDRLPDAGTSSSAGNPCACCRFHRFQSSRSATCEVPLRGLSDLDLALPGDRRRTTSSRSTENKTCFFSIPSQNLDLTLRSNTEGGSKATDYPREAQKLQSMKLKQIRKQKARDQNDSTFIFGRAKGERGQTRQNDVVGTN